MNELVSIIVVNWNGKKWLKKCFDSLFSQTYRNFEIIFVDNNSTDDSVEYIRDNYDATRICIVKSEKNLGFAGGNNLGIKKAQGKYIMLFNNDAWVDANFLQKMFDFYTQHDFDVVGPIETDYANNTVYDCEIKIDFFGHPIHQPRDVASQGFYLPGVCLFFQKELYEKTLGLDERFFMYFEEVDWFWRLNLLKKKFSSIKGLYIHHAGSGSTGGGIKYNAFLWRNQNCLLMLLKNYSLINLVWVLPIYFFQNIVELLFFLLLLKPKIAMTYFQGWWFNIKHLKETFEKRRWVQKHRVVSDLQIMKDQFYFGFAKFLHLKQFVKSD